MPSVWWNGRRRREWKEKRPKDGQREKNRRFQSRFSTKRNLKWNAPSWNYLRTHKSYINLDNGNFSNVIFTHQPLSFSMHFFRLAERRCRHHRCLLCCSLFSPCAQCSQTICTEMFVSMKSGKISVKWLILSLGVSQSLCSHKNIVKIRALTCNDARQSLSLLFPYLANELFNFAS